MATGSSPTATGGSAADLGIVVVSYNVRDLLDRCLESVAESLDALRLRAEVWVVDNASQDDSGPMAARRHPWARLVLLEENRGYGAAANIALEGWLADPQGPETFLVLNPDTELTADSLVELLRALDDPDTGIAGPALVYPNGGFQHSAFRFPGLVQVLLDLFPVDRLADTVLNGRYPRGVYRRGRPFPVDFPLGACLLVRAQAARRAGVLDEHYFMYCEEIDWCYRLRDAGYRAVCVPAAQVVHHAGASTRQFRESMFVALWRSRLRLFRQHLTPWKAVLLATTIRLGFGLREAADRWAVRRGRLDPGSAERRRRAHAAVWSGSAA